MTKMPNFQQQQKLRHAQKQKNVTNQATETVIEGAQMMNLADKDLNYISKEQNETMLKEVKENIMALTYQIVNIHRNDKKEPSGNSGVEKYNT